MPNKPSYNVVTIQVEVETQFGIEDAVKLINEKLKCPAIRIVVFMDGKTNFMLHSEPADKLRPVVMEDVLKRIGFTHGGTRR